MNENALPTDSISDGPSFAARLRPALIRFFKRKTGSAVDAEDLTQDVLVRALSHASWKTPEQAKGYIFRAAVNRLRDRRRRMQSHGISTEWTDALFDEIARENGSQNPLERVLILQEELTEIDRALEGLNLRTRTVLVLIKLEQLKPTEVSQMLGISVRAVNKHVQKGIAHLVKVCRLDERLP